eukprot:117185-Prymnesium_polylepis.1
MYHEGSESRELQACDVRQSARERRGRTRQDTRGPRFPAPESPTSLLAGLKAFHVQLVSSQTKDRVKRQGHTAFDDGCSHYALFLSSWDYFAALQQRCLKSVLRRGFLRMLHKTRRSGLQELARMSPCLLSPLALPNIPTLQLAIVIGVQPVATRAALTLHPSHLSFGVCLTGVLVFQVIMVVERIAVARCIALRMYDPEK